MDENPYQSPEFVEPLKTLEVPKRAFPWRVFPAILFWVGGGLLLCLAVWMVGVSLSDEKLIMLFSCFACSGLLTAAGFFTWKQRWMRAFLAFALTCFVVWICLVLYASP